MKSFGLGIPLIFIFCLVGLALPVAAEQNTTTDHLFIYLDETESEIATDVYVVENNDNIVEITKSNHLVRVSPIFSAQVWMKVGSTWGGKSAQSKYWYVEYVSGRKYQGYVYWTGDKRVANWGPPPQMEFKFQGTLDLV